MTGGGAKLRALVVRVSAVGDVVHTLPAAAVLAAEGWEVDWLVEPPARSLVEGNPAVSHVVVAPRARRFSPAAARTALLALRSRRYDVALDLQGLWKSAAWARLSGAARTVGLAAPARREPSSAVLLREKIEPGPQAVHVVDRSLAVLRALGIEALGRREFPLPAAPEAAARVASRVVELGLEQFAIVNPGGGWASKLWPAASWGALAQYLRARKLVPLVTWGPGEEGLAEQVLAASRGAAVRCFPTSLLEFAALARRARLVVAADTGPMHLACAVGAPVVGIFGPTDPARNGPFAPEDLVVRRTPLCSPCHRRKCDIHKGVMEAITPEQVIAAVDRRLASAHPRVAV